VDENDARVVARAEELFRSGYLCSQSILLAFAASAGLDEQTAARIASTLGAGMARQGWTCGALTGAFLVLGLHCGHSTPAEAGTKEDLFARARALAERFRERHGATSCRDLTGCDLLDPAGRQAATDRGVFTKRCPGFVRTAAGLAADMIKPTGG
jgi:C_GCAxxG_C_C family probable redox protein